MRLWTAGCVHIGIALQHRQPRSVLTDNGTRQVGNTLHLCVLAAVTGVHLALFGWFWHSSPSLALAVALNWGLGKLSLAKWGILLFLASSDRMWLYFLFLAGKMVDKALAKLFPPVREFFWAMFTMWMLFVAVTPTYYYPLPFAPFAPGTLGAQEAIA